jgi:RimJ/RimL family protein N-acetyltransferase
MPQPDATSGTLVVRALTREDAEEIRSWRYPGRWRTYDSRPEDGPVSAAAGFHAIADSTGALVGYLCLGAEARVPGLAAEDGVTDVGVGLRPDLMGQGVGSHFGAAVLAHVRDMSAGGSLRAVVQDWNARSLRLCERLGFRRTGVHTCVQEGQPVTYVVLEAGEPG